MDYRSLRYQDEKSDKFWSIALTGCSHTVNYGRYGTDGQTQTKDFPTEDAARKSYDKLVAEKLKKGYLDDRDAIAPSIAVTTTPPTSVASQPATNLPDRLPINWRELAFQEIQASLVQNKKQLCELAAIDAIPHEYLNLLNVEAKKTIASQKTTAKNLLIRLASDRHDRVRQAIAENPATPEEALKLLAQDQVENVRYALAKNIYTPLSVLELLVGDAFTEIREAIYQHPNITDELCESISTGFTDSQKHFFSINRFHARRKRDVEEPITMWNQLIKVSDTILQNMPRINWSALTAKKVLAYDSSFVRMAIIQNSRTPIRVLEELAKHDASGWYQPHPVLGNGFIRRGIIQEAVACNPNTPVSALHNLANTNNLFVCIALASNPALPEDLIWKLFENDGFIYAFDQGGSKFKWEEYEVGYGPGYENWLNDLHWELARNSQTPLEILEKLSEHDAKYVSEIADRKLCDRYIALANNPDTSVEKLRELLNRRNLDVKIAAAKNPKIFTEFLQEQLNCSKSLLRFLVLLHSGIPENSLRQASKSKKWTDRYAISQNPSTPKDILEKLAEDEHLFVRAAARSTLGLEVICSPAVEAIEVKTIEKPEAVEEYIAVAVVKSPPVEFKIERTIDLNLEDCLWVNGKPRQPQIRAATKLFDLQDALIRLNEIEVRTSNNTRDLSGYFSVNWDNAKISNSLSPEEANFWLTAMTCDIPGIGGRPCGYWSRKNLEDLGDFLGKVNYGNLPDLKQTICALLTTGRFVHAQIVQPLERLFSVIEIIVELYDFYCSDSKNVIEYVSLVFSQDYIARYNGSHPAWSRERSIEEIGKTLKQESRYLFDKLISGFKLFVCPYLGNEEIQLLQNRLRPALNLQTDILQIYKLAAYLGMHAEVRAQIAIWQPHPQNIYSLTNGTVAVNTSDAMEIILGLGNADEIESNIRRFNLRICNIRGWLANTGFNGLDLICKSVNDDQTLQTFGLVKAPEVAPYMLELWLSLKKPQLARQWLEDYPIYAVVGLIPVVAGTWVDPVRVKPSELKKAAIDLLISMKRKGYEPLIRSALERETPEIAAKVRSLILDLDEPNYIPFDRATTPQWLQAGILDLPKQKRSKPPAWVSYADLPPIVIGDRCLDEAQINACLSALSLSTLDSPLPLVQNLKTHANPQSLDTFSWSLFDRWLTEGAPNKEKWAMMALGLLGSDRIALKLTPLIRTWPGESQHARAVLGLECLRAIGTDTALMQIHGIAQKIKFQGLKSRAQDCMEAIARDRHLTAEQLADRIIPDCGLDDKGQRTFDFGARQFQFLLGLDLKPMLRDPQGKKITTLPKPNSTDDPEQAERAIADWKLMKKQISEVAKIHSLRLERAMVEHRTWNWQDFETLLVRHPLLTHLVQRLIWATYDPQGTIQTTFRVAEDITYTDDRDNPYQPDLQAIVGIPHPLTIDTTTKSLWGEILSNYEIIPPFPQLDRDVYILTDV